MKLIKLTTTTTETLKLKVFQNHFSSLEDVLGINLSCDEEMFI